MIFITKSKDKLDYTDPKSSHYKPNELLQGFKLERILEAEGYEKSYEIWPDNAEKMMEAIKNCEKQMLDYRIIPAEMASERVNIQGHYIFTRKKQ